MPSVRTGIADLRSLPVTRMLHCCVLWFYGECIEAIRAPEYCGNTRTRILYCTRPLCTEHCGCTVLSLGSARRDLFVLTLQDRFDPLRPCRVLFPCSAATDMDGSPSLSCMWTPCRYRLYEEVLLLKQSRAPTAPNEMCARETDEMEGHSDT